MAAEPKKCEKGMLLSTKLKMPRPRRDYIIRRTLFQKLSRCAEMSVVFVKGAAGMGKTTLLSTFIAETGLKNTSWLSLDESNNNLYSFWHYFTAAADTLAGAPQSEPELQPVMIFEPHEIKRSLVFLINSLCSDTDYYIVLDDFHCIGDPALLESLEFFLQSMPENLHLFLLSREDPPVYLGEIAVSGKLLFLSGEDMKLSHDESMAFLKSTMKLRADEAELENISSFAEGWVGGLQLAAAGGNFSGALMKHGGSFAAEYLTREVFGKLAPDEQTFLVRTGCLPWFSRSVCTALFPSLDFNAMVETLLNKNLFLICVDEEKGIYRYHNILSEYLREQFSALPDSQQKEWLVKAAAAFTDEGANSEAAGLLLSVKDYSGAEKSILEMPVGIESGAYIARLPEDFIVESIDLTTRALFCHASIGDIESFSRLCAIFSRKWENTPISGLFRYASALLTRKVLPLSPSVFSMADFDRYEMRKDTAAFIQLGIANLMVLDRQYRQAQEFADNAQQLCDGSAQFRYYILSLKAQLNEETGNLNAALENYREIRAVTDGTTMAFMQEFNYRIAITGVCLKRMELDRAMENLEAARDIVAKAKNISQSMVIFSLYYNLAEYQMLCGDSEQGSKLILQILKERTSVRWADRLLIELDAAGKMPSQLREQTLEEYEDCRKENVTLSPSFELLCARLLLSRNELQKAEEIINSVLSFSRESGNALRLVEADLLLLRTVKTADAAARRRQNNLLCEAVYYAAENRILQPFYVERDIINPLWSGFTAALSEKLSENELLFVRDAIRVCSGVAPEGTKELLSSREAEVLAELAKDKTNQQIADDLCISVSTVKTHLLSIYGKLGVSSRMSAAAEGKRLGLISQT